jgi:hypothetical protein
MTLIAGALQAVFGILFGLIANIMGILTGAFLVASVKIFEWITSKDFISLSYTNVGLASGEDGFNYFVNVGWTLTRDLTNIVIVIALIVIGLGTALRMSGYQAQKALPTLIIIALLINFTPVILGLIIDASNIATNFFITDEGFKGGNTMAIKIFGQWNNVKDLVGGVKFWDPIATNQSIAAAIGSMTVVGFNFIAGIIYLLFAFLFLIRYIALWLLVILSPLAFASYILPATRQVWSMWWKQFIQWCLVGLIAAFFLYLADQLIYMIAQGGGLGIQENMEDIGGYPGASIIFNNILPYAVPVVLLFVGLFASLTFAPQGAGAIIKGGQRAALTGGKIISKRYFKTAGGAVKGLAKAPGKTTRTYQAARRMGMDRKKALGTAISRPVSRPARTWRRYKPPLPKEEPISTYRTARGMGFTRKDALKEATRHWKEWTPAGPKMRAATTGLKKAISEDAGQIWKSAVKPPKKKDESKKS